MIIVWLCQAPSTCSTCNPVPEPPRVPKLFQDRLTCGLPRKSQDKGRVKESVWPSAAQYCRNLPETKCTLVNLSTDCKVHLCFVITLIKCTNPGNPQARSIICYSLATSLANIIPQALEAARYSVLSQKACFMEKLPAGAITSRRRVCVGIQNICILHSVWNKVPVEIGVHIATYICAHIYILYIYICKYIHIQLYIYYTFIYGYNMV